MKNHSAISLCSILILTTLACTLHFAATPEPQIDGTVPLPENVANPTPLPATETAQTLESPELSDLIRQGASRSRLDPYEIDDVALGLHVESDICGESYLADLPDDSGEIMLMLTYPAALIPEQIEIYTDGQSHGIRHIEIFNALSGLGRLVYESGNPLERQNLTSGPCNERLTIPTQSDIEADTVFISFETPTAVAQLGVVEMLGRLNAYTEPPVFWRVPLPGTPAGLAVSKNSLVFAASEPNSLFAYDFEGNQLEQFSVPDEALITDIAADSFGNLVAVDFTYGWFIVISPEGEHLAIGGESVFGEAAVSPLDGNLYLLMGSQIHVYTTETGEFLRLMPLDDLRTHTSLAFAPDGRLFTLQDFDWEPKLLELNTLTGQELDTLSVERSRNVDIVASDLTIDAVGNFYILFRMNTANIAVHMLNPDGVLLKRFGKITSDPDDRPEGTFFEPCAITVSPDGRFILIADGYEADAALTAFRRK